MRVTPFILAALIACNLAACGHQGKLKTPSQIEADAAKKERKKEKEQRQQQKEEAKKKSE
jgi:predicted small lipoprotein YifL